MAEKSWTPQAAAAVEANRKRKGEFGAHDRTCPEATLDVSDRSDRVRRAGRVPLASIPNGYRTAADAGFCDVHSAKASASGRSIEEFPQPQQPG